MSERPHGASGSESDAPAADTSVDARIEALREDARAALADGRRLAASSRALLEDAVALARLEVRRRPWALVAGAGAAGFALALLERSPRARSAALAGGRFAVAALLAARAKPALGRQP